jgi:uncharacterized protein YutE (UPF0331/DUF86 family)
VARLSTIANCVNALRELQSLSYNEFASDHVLHSSAERDFQVAIQAALDIASMLLAEYTTTVPEDYASLFSKLAEVGIVPPDLAYKLVGMAKFRNILVHMYLQLDLKRVYSYLQHNLGDLELFAQYVSEYLTRAA